jgi:ABC-type transporter Mla maintaining outer membrane lipid asymmetry ATPase subunit MlaF
LGGFDSSFDGNVYYVKEAGDSRRTVGWCSQSDALYAHLTIREHCELFCALLSVSGVPLASLTVNAQSVSSGITNLLASLDLLEHQHKYPTALSGGMKRRLSLSLAALGDPLLLLLDEPTSGCDRCARQAQASVVTAFTLFLFIACFLCNTFVIILLSSLLLLFYFVYKLMGLCFLCSCIIVIPEKWFDKTFSLANPRAPC